MSEVNRYAIERGSDYSWLIVYDDPQQPVAIDRELTLRAARHKVRALNRIEDLAAVVPEATMLVAVIIPTEPGHNFNHLLCSQDSDTY